MVGVVAKRADVRHGARHITSIGTTKNRRTVTATRRRRWRSAANPTSMGRGLRTDLGATGFSTDHRPTDQGALIDLQFA
jgi:hypothetical protein